jgi:hypothetical protein
LWTEEIRPVVPACCFYFLISDFQFRLLVLLQAHAVEVRVGVGGGSGEGGLKAGEDGGIALKGYEGILLRSGGGDANGEEAEAKVGEFVGGAVVEVGGIGCGDQWAGG